jgi:hypothetical protein
MDVNHVRVLLLHLAAFLHLLPDEGSKEVLEQVRAQIQICFIRISACSACHSACIFINLFIDSDFLFCCNDQF